MYSVTERRASIESTGSHDTFEGEMDNFLEELRQKRKSAETTDKRDPDEDNISEEKVKQELIENEKGDNNHQSELESPRVAPRSPRTSPDERASSPWSDTSDPVVSSPEPEDKTPPRPVTSPDNSEMESSMDSDLDRAASRSTVASDSQDDEDFDGYYDMTEDQRKAMIELHQMKLDLADVGYSEEEPPEYDVAERVRQLNEELAKEPTPNEDQRERSIKFKEDLVDVAPAPDYPSDEEGPTSPPPARAANGVAGGPGPSANDLNLNKMNLNDDTGQQGAGGGGGGGEEDAPRRALGPPPPAKRVGFAATEDRTVNGANDDDTTDAGSRYSKAKGQENADHSNSDADEKVLVERGGKFELLRVKDLSPEERMLYLPPPGDEDGIGEPASVEEGRSNSAPDPAFQPTPPREPRPATASGDRRPLVPQPRRRVQSAAPQRKTVEHGRVHLNSSYQSPYALSPELKKIGERQQKQQKDRERREKEIARIEEQEKLMRNEEYFKSWLENKRREGAWRRQRPDEDEATLARKKEEKACSEGGSVQDKESEVAFQSWLKTKREQQRRERQVDVQRKQEEEEAWFERPRQECDKAFRQYVFQEWLKKKNQDAKKAKKQDVARQRINKLLVRRTRKAMQLARAIRQSQSFRYVDYYGYRY